MKLIHFLILTFFSQSLFAQKCDTLIPYRSGKLWGYSDYRGKIIIQPQYDKVDFFNDNLGRVYKNTPSKKRLETLIDTLGILMVPLKYSEVTLVVHRYLISEIFSSQYEELKKKGRFKDTTHYEADKILSRNPNFNKSLYYVTDTGSSKMGIYDSKLKKEVAKCVFNEIKTLGYKKGKHLFKVRQKMLWGIIDQDGTVLQKCVNEDIYLIQNHTNGRQDSIIIVKKIPKDEMYDDIMMESLPPIDWEEYLNYGIVRDNITKKMGLSIIGSQSIPLIYDTLYLYEMTNLKNLYVAKKDGKWGVVNSEKSGDTMIPFLYDAIGESYFHSGMYECVVKVGENWGVVNDSKYRVPVLGFKFKDELKIDPYLRYYNVVLITNGIKDNSTEEGYQMTGIYFMGQPEKAIYNSKIELKHLPFNPECMNSRLSLIEIENADGSANHYINTNGFKYCDDK